MNPIIISIIWMVIDVAVIYGFYRIFRPFVKGRSQAKITALVIIFLSFTIPAVYILIRHIH